MAQGCGLASGPLEFSKFKILCIGGILRVMSVFGLDAKSVLRRLQAGSSPPHVPTCGESLLAGSLGFALVSLVVFGTVAFGERWLYAHLGRLGSYAFWTLLFVGGAGAMLNLVVIGQRTLARFYGVFTLGFLTYAVTWTAAYFIFKREMGEWIGGFIGTIFMALVLCGTFGALHAVGRATAAMLGGNLAGYFLGRLVWTSVAGSPGMIGWGIIYGLGFGLGLGYTLYACQARVRSELIAKSALASPSSQS